jgi:tRNA 2-thiouridine synthesizing protein B
VRRSSTLHTVNRSPFERNSLDSCLRVMRPGAAILLYEDGVYAAVAGTTMEAKLSRVLESSRVYCLQADLAARGLETTGLLQGIELVSYQGFVELSVEHERVQAWA